MYKLCNMLLLRFVQQADRNYVSASVNEILTERAVIFSGDYVVTVERKSHSIQRIGNAYANSFDVAFLESPQPCEHQVSLILGQAFHQCPFAFGKGSVHYALPAFSHLFAVYAAFFA